MKKKIVPIACAFAVLSAFPMLAGAQDVKPDRAIKYRQGVLQAMGWNFFGILGPMAKGEIPYNKEKAVKAATWTHELAAMPFDGFIPGSDTGAPTKAKPEIWKDRAKFDKLAHDMQAETVKLVAAAQTGDPAALRKAVTATGAACKACHDDFRNK